MPTSGNEATVVLSGVGKELSEDILRKMYSSYGPIVRIRHNKTNSAHVIFDQRTHALKAVEATNGAVVFGKTLKVALQRKFRKTTEPCRGFAAGICRQGDRCKYYHVTDNAMYALPASSGTKPMRELKKKTLTRKKSKNPVELVAVPSVAETIPPTLTGKESKNPVEPVAVPSVVETVPPTLTGKESKKLAEAVAVPSVAETIPPTKLCRHFSRGYCATGSACTFAHVLGLAKEKVPAGKAAKLCQFYLNNVCSRGDACKYIHSSPADLAPKKAKAARAPVAAKEEVVKKEIPDQDAETYTCIECDKPGVAVWQCAKCDNSLYCAECDSIVHQARVMAKHERIKLPPLRTMPPCGECETNPASVQCEQCDVVFCASCDVSVHKFKCLRKHVRVKLSTRTEIAKGEKIGKELEALIKQYEKTTKVSVVEGAAVPVSYVESIPKLEFSSDSSEAEDEDVQSSTAHITSDDEAEPTTTAFDTESDDGFEDDKPESFPSNSGTPRQPCVPKQNDEALRPNSARVSALKADLSSESDEDSQDEAQSASNTDTSCEPVVEKTKKVASKAESAHRLRQQRVSTSDSLASSEDELPSAQPTTKPSQSTLQASKRNQKGVGISTGSSHTLVKKIEAFNDSSDCNELHLDATLNGFERLLAHDCAERLGLAHESVGSGLERHIIISRRDDKKRGLVDTGAKHQSKKNKRCHKQL